MLALYKLNRLPSSFCMSLFLILLLLRLVCMCGLFRRFPPLHSIMAFTSKLTLVPIMLLLSMALVLLFCSVVMKETSDCEAGSECFYVEMEMQSRKLLSEKQLVKGGVRGSSAAVKVQNLDGLELRMVPSGPDPMHHNANPKKPRTP